MYKNGKISVLFSIGAIMIILLVAKNKGVEAGKRYKYILIY